MQGTFTTSLLLSVTDTEVAKTNTYFLEVPGSSSKNDPSSGNFSISCCLGYPVFFSHQPQLHLALLPVARVLFFWSRFFFFLSRYSLLLSMREVFPDSVDLKQGGAGFLPSADFASLGLDSSGLDSLPIVTWVYIFEAVLLERRWPLRQRASKSRSMVLDLRPALASVLTAFCTISSKSMGSWSWYFILTFMKDLRLFRK